MAHSQRYGECGARTKAVRWRMEIAGASYGARAGAWLRREGENPRVPVAKEFWAVWALNLWV
ncbi:hypothetical protein V6Z11_A09G143100 [Gossypium hirsutum]